MPGIDDTLLGRDAEQAALERAMDAARAGQGGAIVLWGDPGIGKTALLGYAAEHATGFQILRCRGTRAESILAFSALHELLWPIVDRIDGLPTPQAEALRGALGLSDRAHDPFLVGVAVLTLLSELAEERPVLVLADDTQWLDAASTSCLSFLTRRVSDESILVLFTAHERPEGTSCDGLPVLHVQGLDPVDARRLVVGQHPAMPDAQIDRVLTLADGNPLALQELPDAMPPWSVEAATLSSGFAEAAASQLDPDEPVEVGPRLRRAFDARVAALPVPVQTALLIVAAGDGAEIESVRSAGQELGLDDDAWQQARLTGLLHLAHGRISMRHPLIRAAVYDRATAAERRAVHRALATPASGLDPDRRAWHAAYATDTPDEQVAAALQDTAARAWMRGARQSSVRALLRAAELSPDSKAAGRRLALAARNEWNTGRVDSARAILRDAEAAAGHRTAVRFSGGLEGMMELGHGDPVRALELFERDAAVAGRYLEPELRHLARRAAWSAGLGDSTTDHDAMVLEALAAGEDLIGWWRLPPAIQAVAIGKAEPTWELFQHVSRDARISGNMTGLLTTLNSLATLEMALGRWDDAAENAASALYLAEQQGQQNPIARALLTVGWLAAVRGEHTDAVAATERALALSRPRRVAALNAAGYWNLGLDALGSGDVDSAWGFLAPILDPEHEAHHPTLAALAAPDAIEAAIRLGRTAEAAAHTVTLAAWAERTGASWAISATELAGALAADGRAAEDHFRAALTVPEAADRPFQQARTQLLYGEWLRRARRRTDARAQLASALRVFDRLQAAPWAARARQESALAGEALDPNPTGSSRTLLTPQELRVARLAAKGLTNRDIAAQLFISPRTVGHHLSHVFPKLGITSRDELAGMDFEQGPTILP
ncbi:AAA family ATPase [Nocardia sp. 2]|uniref:AAA family ATPase n=1 Tax=Nocardia acididurans TaxID=2802282 RepID=A0ABS1MHA5_9NOCA|nr:LuxR family transcriptional regulator [Nocardia acididurans]MBL1079942.1 AAA family ATPase [Nocardia acididurans]